MLTISFGTVIWTTIAFMVVFTLLAKFAWKPILKMIAEREQSIENALNEAKRAKEEMANLKADNEALLNEARRQRDTMLQEAKEIKDRIVSEAKDKAREEAERITETALREIDNQKKAAMTELKNQVGQLSVEIAEKVLRQHLADNEQRTILMNSLLQDAKLN
jgi:F-type H+-transporting ATPase subunit b